MLRTVMLPFGRRSRMPRSLVRFELSHLTPQAQLLVLLARTSANGTLQVEIQDRLRDRLDWTLLWRLAREHGVSPLVYRTLLSYGKGAIPSDAIETFRHHVQSNAILNGLLADELVALVEAFATKGIRVIPFNGPILALTAYGDISLRECPDLGFIVGPSAVHQARQLLWSRGYQLASQSHVHGNEELQPFHSFVKNNGMFRVDLQSAMGHRRFEFDPDRERIWDQLKPMRFGERTIMTLGPEELLILLCMHGSKHAWEDLKWVCDVAELVRRRRAMDWSRILFLSHEWGCRRLLLMGLATAHTLFDTPLPRSMQDAILADPDVGDLAKRKPRRLLRTEQEGVGEADAEAFHLTLKDSWVGRWTYALALCRAEVPLAVTSPPWFRFQGRLTLLYQLCHPFYRVADWCARFLRNKKALGKRLEIPG